MARCLILYTRGNGTVALSGQTQCILQKHLHIEKCCKKDTKQWNKTQWKKEKQHKLRILKKTSEEIIISQDSCQSHKLTVNF